MADLVSFDNPKGTITNSDLELASLVVQEVVLPQIIKCLAWCTPTSCSNNNPTVAWAFRDSATINPAGADILSIRSDHNVHHRIVPSVFYHPGELDIMTDNASRRFGLYCCRFLGFFHSAYLPQYPSLWQLCHLPT